MIIREEIKNYNVYLARINRLTLEIHDLEVQNYNLKSPVIDGMPRATNFSKSIIEEKTVNNLEKITLKRQEIQRLRDILNLLGALINTLKELNRKVIRSRYIENQDIQRIADENFKDYKTIQGIIDNSINIMQENYEK